MLIDLPKVTYIILVCEMGSYIVQGWLGTQYVAEDDWTSEPLASTSQMLELIARSRCAQHRPSF